MGIRSHDGGRELAERERGQFSTKSSSRRIFRLVNELVISTSAVAASRSGKSNSVSYPIISLEKCPFWEGICGDQRQTAALSAPLCETEEKVEHFLWTPPIDRAVTKVAGKIKRVWSHSWIC